MDNLKICLAIVDLPICSGVNTQALNLALKLREMGADPFFVFGFSFGRVNNNPCNDKSYVEKLKSLNFRMFQKPDGVGNKNIEDYRFFFKLFRQLHKDYQIIYINGITKIVCWFVPFFKLSGKKVVIKLTGLGINDPLTLKNRSKFGWLEFKLLSFADSFIGTSSSLCESFIESGLLPRHKLVQIPNGVDTSLFTPLKDENLKKNLREKLNLPPDHKIITFVGSIKKDKGVDLLLEVWDRVLEKYPKTSLVMLGNLCFLCPSYFNQDSDFFKLLEKKAGIYLIQRNKTVQMLNSDKPKNNIMILGKKTNVHEYLQASDIFAFLSRLEGMPNALMEAMAAGLPCITSDIGAIKGDLINDNEVGLAISEENTQELLEKILTLLEDEEKRLRMGQTALNKILDKYPIEKIARQHYTLYKKLLSK